MRVSNIILILIHSLVQLRPGSGYSGRSHVRIRWHIRNMMQALVYDGLRRADTVEVYMNLYMGSDHWFTGKLASIIRSKGSKMWRLLERAYTEMDALTIHEHVMLLDQITGLGGEVDHLTEVMEEYLAVGGRAGLRAARAKAKAASAKLTRSTAKPDRRRIEQIVRENEPDCLRPEDIKGINAGESSIMRLMASFQRHRSRHSSGFRSSTRVSGHLVSPGRNPGHRDSPGRSPGHRDSPDNGGFDSAEYHDYGFL